MTKTVAPAHNLTAFNCPHCSAYSGQDWHILYAKPLDGAQRVPYLPAAAEVTALSKMRVALETSDANQKIWRLGTRLIWIQPAGQAWANYEAENLFLSTCYACKRTSVWVHDRLVFPFTKATVVANSDLGEDITADFEEAASIVDQSPRGAAALLRLCIQKLCLKLGEKGKNIDDDIASLVRKGLSPILQQALDIVRVVGNEAVHPGTIDLRDDKETAIELFGLVNLIGEQMITGPKKIQELYGRLPEAKRQGIENRDKPKG